MAEKLCIRKKRFMQFASVQYDGEYYMTPRDFLFSVMFDKPRRKTVAKKLTKKEADAALANVVKAKPGPCFFRDLGDKGLSKSDQSDSFPFVADEDVETKMNGL
ncbi:UNVERIFIED_CONTAM: Calcium uptake protein 2, mitochondrial [Gekko kuhli]